MVKHATSSPSVITIDLLFLVLSRSVFHPFVAWLVPVCLLSTRYPSNHPFVVWTSYYALLVSLVALLQALDQRVAYGRPRKLDWDEEVVVVTGGASGLGRIMVEMYGLRGVSVAVLDVTEPTKQDLQDNAALDPENVRWYKCDVSSRQDVERASKQIQKDVGYLSLDHLLFTFIIARSRRSPFETLNPQDLATLYADIVAQLGRPTILINNAGIMHGLPLLSLTSAQVSSTIAVNLQSHFNTLQTFLPSILASPSGGTIVTISSVLGHLGAAYLSDYTASKAGLLALHASLVAELASTYRAQGGDKVKTILVAPGQLATRLFEGLQTPSPFLGPIVEPIELARETVRMIDAGVSGEIRLPLYSRFIALMGILPPGLRSIARWMSGVDRAMATRHRDDSKNAL